MLGRLAIPTVALLLFAHLPARGAEREHLQRGGKRLTADYQLKYDRAIRHVLSRGWQKDVVLRMVNIPPFEPETVAGIARTPNGYVAFEATAPKNLWYALHFSSDRSQREQESYQGFRPVLHERPLPQAMSARIAALWRRVLTDPRNYEIADAEAVSVDADQFTYTVNFLPHEHISAYAVGWGPHSEALVWVARAVGNHAKGAPEKALEKVVKKAEARLGI
jgi:hypothetical protein